MTWLSAITLALIVRIVGHIFTVIFAACHSQAREYLRREIKHHQRMFTWRLIRAVIDEGSGGLGILAGERRAAGTVKNRFSFSSSRPANATFFRICV